MIFLTSPIYQYPLFICQKYLFDETINFDKRYKFWRKCLIWQICHDINIEANFDQKVNFDQKNNFDDIPVPLTPLPLRLLIMTLGRSDFCTKMKLWYKFILAICSDKNMPHFFQWQWFSASMQHCNMFCVLGCLCYFDK